jgi:predicted RNase H-like nuclease
MRFAGTIREIDEWRADHDADAPLAVDIPIGVRAHGGARRCDDDARTRLRRSAATVFSPPGRYLLAARDYAEVRHRVDERRARAKDPVSVPGVSAQSAALIPRIKDVDDYLRKTRRRLGGHVFEVHPELCFLRMNEGQPLAAKSSARGQLRRLELVRNEFPSIDDAIAECEWARHGSLIDILDAAAALWTALRRARGDSLEILGRGDHLGGLPAEIAI